MEQPTRWSLQDLLAEPVNESLEENFSKLEQALGELEALRECLAAYLPSPLAGPMLRQRIAVNAEAPLDVLAVEARRTPVFRLTEMSAVR